MQNIAIKDFDYPDANFSGKYDEFFAKSRYFSTKEGCEKRRLQHIATWCDGKNLHKIPNP